jgi:ABC-type Fe3+-hydroxamate transport system substrate-binding protein
MIRSTAQALLGLAALALAAGCAGHPAPGPSKITTPYQVKVDDAVREAASIQLVTTRSVVLSEDCDKVTAAGSGALDRLVAAGVAARLPADVTVYATPYDPITLDSLPEVVTDDGYAGKLCTPHSFSMEASPAPQKS